MEPQHSRAASKGSYLSSSSPGMMLLATQTLYVTMCTVKVVPSHVVYEPWNDTQVPPDGVYVPLGDAQKVVLEPPP